MKKIYSLEIFKLNWQGKKIITQYILCDSVETADFTLQECLKEYSDKTIELLEDKPEYKLYKITVPAVEGMTPEDDFFIGYFEMGVKTIEDIRENIEIANARKQYKDKPELKFEITT